MRFHELGLHFLGALGYVFAVYSLGETIEKEPINPAFRARSIDLSYSVACDTTNVAVNPPRNVLCDTEAAKVIARNTAFLVCGKITWLQTMADAMHFPAHGTMYAIRPDYHGAVKGVPLIRNHLHAILTVVDACDSLADKDFILELQRIVEGLDEQFTIEEYGLESESFAVNHIDQCW